VELIYCCDVRLLTQHAVAACHMSGLYSELIFQQDSAHGTLLVIWHLLDDQELISYRYSFCTCCWGIRGIKLRRFKSDGDEMWQLLFLSYRPTYVDYRLTDFRLASEFQHDGYVISRYFTQKSTSLWW